MQGHNFIYNTTTTASNTVIVLSSNITLLTSINKFTTVARLFKGIDPFDRAALRSALFME